MTQLPILPPRSPDSHKGDFGRALLVGGSRGLTGAIGLAGMATLRSGAGLVTLAVPESCLGIIASYEPSYMTAPLPCDSAGRIAATARNMIVGHATGATCLTWGPGLGRSEELTGLVTSFYRTTRGPMVLDADALYALAMEPEHLRATNGPVGPRVLTPHQGEFHRLIGGEKLDRPQAEAAAIRFADECGIVLVLKGHRTLITDGDRSTYNTTGNPGMATGGSGDVLTGVITALICQGLKPYEAAQLGVHVHGLAGDLAAAELGQVSLIARDLIEYLPKAFQALT
jgi:NAD(P)H-hydrate epimerase